MSLSVLETVLVGLNVDRDVREAITGDLMEERAQIAAVHGERRADRWMRRQIVLSALAFMRAVVWNGGVRAMSAIVGAALAALLAVGLASGVSVALLYALLSPETIGRLTIVAFALDLAYGGAGGYLAARFGRAAPLGAAFVFGILCTLVTVLWGGDAHGWDRHTLQFLLIPVTVAGGWLRAHHLRDAQSR